MGKIAIELEVDEAVHQDVDQFAAFALTLMTMFRGVVSARRLTEDLTSAGTAHAELSGLVPAVDETRHLHLQFPGQGPRVDVRPKELSLFSVLLWSPVLYDARNLLAACKRVDSGTWAMNSETHARNTYSALAKKLRGTSCELITRGGVYGFRACERRTRKRKDEDSSDGG